jgi:hypothetical protein
MIEAGKDEEVHSTGPRASPPAATYESLSAPMPNESTRTKDVSAGRKVRGPCAHFQSHPKNWEINGCWDEGLLSVMAKENVGLKGDTLDLNQSKETLK